MLELRQTKISSLNSINLKTVKQHSQCLHLKEMHKEKDLLLPPRKQPAVKQISTVIFFSKNALSKLSLCCSILVFENVLQ